MYKILVSGYFGFNNLGDEAILKGLVEGIRREGEDCDLVVLSRYPQFTAMKHHVRSINRMNFFQICKELKETDLFVSGGGSLLQDVTSKRSIMYYLGLIFLAKKIFRKKVMVYSQGVGPVHGKFNRFLMRKILQCVDLINVRDQGSAKALEEMNIRKDFLITTDTVFGMDKPSKENGRRLLEELGIGSGPLNIGLSIRMWKNLDSRIVEESALLIRKIVEDYNANVVLIPFQYYKDSRIMKEIKGHLQDVSNKVFMIQDYLYVEDYLSIIGNMDLMISMRLHGLIFSLIMGARPIGISYDPKIQCLLESINMPLAMEVEELQGETLYLQIKEAIEDLEQWKQEAPRLLNQLMDKSKGHNQALWDLLRGN